MSSARVVRRFIVHWNVSRTLTWWLSLPRNVMFPYAAVLSRPTDKTEDIKSSSTLGETTYPAVFIWHIQRPKLIIRRRGQANQYCFHGDNLNKGSSACSQNSVPCLLQASEVWFLFVLFDIYFSFLWEDCSCGALRFSLLTPLARTDFLSCVGGNENRPPP